MPAGNLADTDIRYLRAMGAADMQVGLLLDSLKEGGRLDNAIVVLFSDHGEDFGMQKDVIRNDAGQILRTGLNGHGTSRASPAGAYDIEGCISRKSNRRFIYKDEPYNSVVPQTI